MLEIRKAAFVLSGNAKIDKYIEDTIRNVFKKIPSYGRVVLDKEIKKLNEGRTDVFMNTAKQVSR